MDNTNEKARVLKEFDNRNTVEVVPYGEEPTWRKQSEQNSFLATIERLAARPDIDPGKIQQFMDMNERILDRDAKQAFNAAMTKAQSQIELVVAKSENLQNL